MKILYGTGNQAKFATMKRMLEVSGEMDIELISLQDLEKEGKEIPKAAETGNTPLENARQKAVTYYQAFQIPVFSCDSGLYFENVPDEIQPGVHVRNVNGVCLSDEEMTEYYAGLAKKYGDLNAQYKNAICFVRDADHIYEAMEDSMASDPFILTSCPHSAIKEKGFPLDCISINKKTGRYYYEISDWEWEQLCVEEEFLRFIKNALEM